MSLKSRKIVKPNYRGNELLRSGSRPHSGTHRMAYRQYLGNYVDVGNTAAIREGTGSTTKWRLSRARKLHLDNNG